MEGRKDTALGLGERLRSARKARALTLEQAAQALHLEEGILAALEEERFSVLGAPVFVRGHLRAYARLLEMSEEAVLEAYREADPASRELPRVARKLEAPVREGPGPWVMVAVIVLLLFAVVFTYISQDRPSAPDPVLITPAEPLPVAPEPAPFLVVPENVPPTVPETGESGAPTATQPAGDPATQSGPLPEARP